MVRSLVTVLVLAACAPVDADPDTPDVGAADLGGPPVCEDDRFGPGTPELPAARLGAGVERDLVLCSGRADWFAVDARPGDSLRVDVEGAGALDAALVDDAGEPLDAGEGDAVTLRAAVPPGGIRLVVRGEGRYTLRVDLEAFEGRCDDEEDDAPERAAALPDAVRTACFGDEDWYAVEAGAGDRVAAVVQHDDGGPVEVGIYDASGRYQAARATADDGDDGMVARVAGPDGRVLLRVRAARDIGEARYRLRADILPDEAARRGSRTGRISAIDRPLGPEGFGPDTPWTVEGLRVDAVGGGGVVGSSVTDAEGRYTIDFVSSGEVEVEARAEVHVGARVVTVEDHDGRVWRGAEPGALDAAVHIAATAADGLRRASIHLPERRAGLPVRFRWQPGAAPDDCNTCFRPGPRPVVDLSGKASDPDEWDDAVILHELGHHLAAVYSRDDSSGGRHAGARTAPEIAWSEGWATFFASWVTGAPAQLDARLDTVRVTDLETMDEPDAFGVDGELVSERLVAAVLWDLYDDPDDDDDPVAVGDAVVWDALLGLRDAAPGVDLADFLDLVVCDAPGISEVLEARGYPYAPPECP